MKAIERYSEEQLIIMLKQHDQTAFSYLYDNYSASLYGAIVAILPDVESAPDVLQEVFVKIWKQISAYDDSKGRLFTWMLTIARNTAIDTMRSKSWKNNKRNNELTEDLITGGVTASPNTDTIGLRKIVHSLREEYRVLVELSYFEGHTQDEISRKLGIPIGTVKTRLRKAIAELGTMIKM
ncbi:RNA polymerase sigma factor [Pollutibacter soli]|uniref:RNA polymerase sigma factor n=1 Tax=Pollutibacter soli TaxID=3034157 RepID=UPI0030135202